MKIAAVSDVHSPRYFTEFERSLSQLEAPNLLLLAGDMVNRGLSQEYGRIVDALEEKLGRTVPIVSCLGNEEYNESQTELAEQTRNMIQFLDDDSILLKIAGKEIGIVSGPAPIDRRTKTTELGGRSIRQRFQQRITRLSRLIEETAGTASYTILLMHYSPLEETRSAGEKPAFSWWISEAIKNAQPDLIIHGHTHSATYSRIEVEGIQVYNVAIPATGVITRIRL